MKLQIITEKPLEMVEAFGKLQEGIMKHGQGQMASNYQQLKPNEFLLELKYMVENRISNWVLEREITNTLRKLDPKIKIKKC